MQEKIIGEMETESQEDIFSEEHRQAVLAHILLNEHQDFEALQTHISEAEWETIYALRKNRPAEEIFRKLGRVCRLTQSQRRFIAGQRPSDYFK